MIHRIIDFSVRNKFLVLLLVGAAAVAGAWSLQRVPLDAIPDLSDTQVISSRAGPAAPTSSKRRSPTPIVTAMLGAPKVARPRVLRFRLLLHLRHFETHRHLLGAHADAGVPLGRPRPLPQDAKTELGPDATGWLDLPVRRLVDTSGQRSLADTALVPGWTLRYYRQVGAGCGRGRVDRRLSPSTPGQRRSEQLRNVTASRSSASSEVVRGGNIEAGGRLTRVRGHRVHGAAARPTRSRCDFESIVVSASEGGTPIRIRDIGPSDHRPGPPARRVGSRRHGRGGVGHHRHAPGRERPRTSSTASRSASRRSSRASPRGWVHRPDSYDRSD